MTDQGEQQRAHTDQSPSELTIVRPDESEPFVPIVGAILLDMAVHLGIGALIGGALWTFVGPGWAIGAGLVAWIGSSFLHRTLIQHECGATFGKAMFDLTLRRADGTAPSFRQLLSRWISGALQVLSA